MNEEHFDDGGAVARVPVEQQPFAMHESVRPTLHQVREVQVCFNPPKSPSLVHQAGQHHRPLDHDACQWMLAVPARRCCNLVSPKLDGGHGTRLKFLEAKRVHCIARGQSHGSLQGNHLWLDDRFLFRRPTEADGGHDDDEDAEPLCASERGFPHGPR